MSEEAPIIEGTRKTLQQLSKDTDRTFRLVLKGGAQDLKVYQIPVKYLYFNIENGRYADRMIRLKAESRGVVIDLRSQYWRKMVREMLLGKGRLGEERDKIAATRLEDDLQAKKAQLTPGVVAGDGGVLDGNRRLAVLQDLGWEHFDGMFLPPDTSAEDKWRIEAGLQLGKQLVHEYSPVNQLLKIREGLKLFREMKQSGRDPAPKKTAEELVAEALYGVDSGEITESIGRIELMENYLEFIGKAGRYDLIGERSERFKEALKIVEGAKNQGWKPQMLGKLKAWIFQNILEENLQNWDLREIYKAIGGNPTKRGRKMASLPKSEKLLKDRLPDPKTVRDACRVVADANEKNEEAKLPPSLKSAADASKDLAEDVLQSVGNEAKTNQPVRLLSEARAKLEKVLGSTGNWKKGKQQQDARKELLAIRNIVDNLLTRAAK